MQEIEVEDWEQNGNKKLLALDPLKDPADQLKRQWRLSQKLRNKLKYSTRFAETTAKEIEELEASIALALLDQDAQVPQQKPEKVPTPPKPKPKSHPFREFKSEKGVSIFIGKGSANNEQLTFSFANGLDLWMHVANHSGCHVVLRAGKDVDEESLLDALQLTLFFSKVQEDEITVAECKNLKRVSGAKKGLVQVGKHRTLFQDKTPKGWSGFFLVPGQSAKGSSRKRYPTPRTVSIQSNLGPSFFLSEAMCTSMLRSTMKVSSLWTSSRS